MVFYNLNYLIYMLPCFILSLICNIAVKSSFSKYSQIANSRRLTGAQAAQQVLSAQEKSDAFLSISAGVLE